LVKLLWLAVAAAVLYGGYEAYLHWGGDGDAGTAAVDLGKDLVGHVQTAASGTISAAGAAAKTYATRVVGEAEQTFLDAAKAQVGEWLAPVGEKLSSIASSLAGTPPGGVGNAVSIPAATGTTFAVPPPPATIVAKPGVLMTLSVNRVSSYTVDWGDGIREGGTAPEDRITLLTHAWAVVGD
jgi:hypothetical protein